MMRVRQVGVWLGAIFLAVVLVYAGVSKLAGASALGWAERFERWGYPANISYVVGVCEILAGLAVLVPQWRRAASLVIGVIMLGALATHVVNAEFARVIPPLVLGGLAFLLYWSRRNY